jgi:hypothetical protein
MRIRMTLVYLLRATACVLAVWAGSVVFAQTAPSEVGTWKVNLAKSTYSPGPPPKSAVLKIEAVGEGRKVTQDAVQPDGSAGHYQFTANYDGKDNPMIGNPNADTAALTRINATTVQTIWKKGGKVTNTLTSVVSADGKTRTTTAKGVNATGQPVTIDLVYDRQ